MKKLLLALLTGTLCASVFAFVGCSDGGNNNEGDLPDESTDIVDGNLPDDSTDITEEDVPLGGSVCQHFGINHASAVNAGCESSGNKEYWYCSSCNKYFSDAEYTVETSLAAVTLAPVGHSYGGWEDATPAGCTTDGEKAHKDCTECNKHFDAENNEIIDLVIEAGHNYGGWIDEVAARGCDDGFHGHYHCDVCGADFNAQYVEFGLLPFQAGSLTITAHHNIKDYPAEEASCIVYGHDAYRQCEDCEKYFDEYGNRAEAPMFLKGFHAYGEFVYDYEAKQYVKVCAHESTHKIEQEAGTAEYPYLASTVEQFTELCGTVKFITLSADIDLRTTETSDTKSYAIRTDTVLDLNGYTLTTKMGFVVGIYNNPAAPVFTVKNGTINRVVDSGSTANKATVSAQGSGELEIINCTITTNQDSAVTVFDACKVTVTDSALTGVYYGLTSNAGAGNYTEAICVKLTNSRLEAQGAGILWNIPASIEIDNCEIKGLGQAMIARGGNITISNSTLIKRAYVEGVDLEMLANGDELVYPQYEEKNWADGNKAPGYALVVGNRVSATSTSYQYATNLTLNNVNVEVEEGVVAKYVYAYGNVNPDYGATITYDADCELGEIVIGDKDSANGSNVTVNAPSLSDDGYAELAA